MGEPSQEATLTAFHVGIDLASPLAPPWCRFSRAPLPVFAILIAPGKLQGSMDRARSGFAWSARGWFILLTVLVGQIAMSSALWGGELHDAAKAGDKATVEHLLKSGASIDETDYILGTPLHLAIKQGSIGVAEVLIDHGADVEAVSELQGARPMHLAAMFGNVPMLQLLLDSGAKIDSRDAYERTPLHQAAIWGQAPAVGFLLERGANTELKDSRYGGTPLIRAALSGRLEVVKLLVEAGADLEARDISGRTALREAATPASWSVVGDASLIEYLVAAGADINARENNGFTILGWADDRTVNNEYYANIAEVLRQLGAKK